MILPVSLNTFKNIQYNKAIKKMTQNTAPCLIAQDTVCFTGHKKKPEELSENVQKACAFAKNIIQNVAADNNYLTPETLEKLLANDDIKITVNNNKRLTGKNLFEPRPKAFVLINYKGVGDYNSNKTEIKSISLNLNFDDDITEIIEFTAHEYTHILQRKEGNQLSLFEPITKNRNELDRVAEVADKITLEFVGFCAEKVFGNKSLEAYCRATKERFKNEDAVFDKIKRTGIDKSLAQCFDTVGKNLSKQLGVDEEEIKKAIKKYINHTSKMEVEAYTTSARVAKKYLKTSDYYIAEKLAFRDIYAYLGECTEE